LWLLTVIFRSCVCGGMTMVVVGGASRTAVPQRRGKAGSIYQYISVASYFVLLFLCFLMICTVLELDDAPDDHGDLHALTVSTVPHSRTGLAVTVPPTTVAYAVTITECGSDDDAAWRLAEGAAVLAYSIHQAHHAASSSPLTQPERLHEQQRYNYTLYAIYHPQAEPCVSKLKDLNYTLLRRDTPVAVHEIRGDFLREKITANGCCGEKELLKLEAYTLTSHEIVVLLDLDVLLLQPLDRLFDFLTYGTPLPRDDLQWPDRPLATTAYRDIGLLYTVDYAMVNPGRAVKPFQGGVLVLRPDRNVYEELRNIVREGDYRDQGGWGGRSRKFWGSMTIQGLLPYYYDILHFNETRALELNRCVYDNMCSKSRNGDAVNDRPTGQCYTQEESCEDCRDRSVATIVATHFTVCQKPWTCTVHGRAGIDHRLCRALHHEWFRVRSDLEQSWGRSGWGTGVWREREQFFGFCNTYGTKGYETITRPYGSARE
jgi:hypothetical protein